jgi:hypothetical protein
MQQQSDYQQNDIRNQRLPEFKVTVCWTAFSCLEFAAWRTWIHRFQRLILVFPIVLRCQLG